ncbi:MAG TPA: hypothetical protein VFE65_03745 [Pseudonocardia sp.]|nr:hypothetical protein [Pseudonocardia sp.]
MSGRLCRLGAAVLVLWLATACGGTSSDISRQPVPTFDSTPAASADSSGRRTTLLPTDCQDIATGATMSALLGKPMDSVRTHTVRGVGAASVGRLERVTCMYQLAGVKAGPPALALNMTAYTTPQAADQQLTTNLNAERPDARAVDNFMIGTARAALLAEKGQNVLLVTSGRCSVTMTLRDGVVDGEQTRAVMVDLIQRVLPNLGPVASGTAR